jgi:large subunit ribosomal protein L21
MSYAIFRIGGRQYRGTPGDIFTVQKIEGDKGATVTFSDVYAIGEGEGIRFGQPLIAGASVSAEILTQTRQKKVLVFKFKRRKNYKRLKGHRQHITRVRITGIEG